MRTEKKKVILLEGTSTYIQHNQIQVFFVLSFFFSLFFLLDELRQCLYSPTTMRLCSESGRIIQSPSSSQLCEQWYMTARGWLSAEGPTTKDSLGKSSALPTDPMKFLSYLIPGHSASPARMACASLSFACLSPAHSLSTHQWLLQNALSVPIPDWLAKNSSIMLPQKPCTHSYQGTEAPLFTIRLGLE